MPRRTLALLIQTASTHRGASSRLVTVLDGNGLSIPVRWAYILLMERICVRQHHRHHHEAGG
jgi:hypothetical protein